LQVSVPSLLSSYRKTPFTLQDGLSEWKGYGGLLFAMKDDTLIGLLRLDKHRTYYELSSFAIHAAFQGHGYGGQMLQHVIKNTDSPVWLRVQRDNPACTLYSRYGFETRDLIDNRVVMRLR
jgi:ribosomal protein S18 acetylase RimI-like enzyme